jgi:hypothetical protein
VLHCLQSCPAAHVTHCYTAPCAPNMMRNVRSSAAAALQLDMAQRSSNDIMPCRQAEDGQADTARSALTYLCLSSASVFAGVIARPAARLGAQPANLAMLGFINPTASA